MQHTRKEDLRCLPYLMVAFFVNAREMLLREQQRCNRKKENTLRNISKPTMRAETPKGCVKSSNPLA
jgi:hypothetical protein